MDEYQEIVACIWLEIDEEMKDTDCDHGLECPDTQDTIVNTAGGKLLKQHQLNSSKQWMRCSEVQQISHASQYFKNFEGCLRVFLQKFMLPGLTANAFIEVWIFNGFGLPQFLINFYHSSSEYMTYFAFVMFHA